jgi:hypothetical protein
MSAFNVRFFGRNAHSPHFNIYLLLLFALSFISFSCSSDDEDNSELPETNAAKTVFLYMPWTGDDNNLYKIFQQNITDIKSAIVSEGGLGDKNFMIFISQSATKGVLIRVKYDNGACVDDTIRTYDNTTEVNLALNSTHWITYIMNQIASYAPADIYSLIIGSHGYGWIDASYIQGATSAAKIMLQPKGQSFPDGTPITRASRSFGGVTVLTDISTLASGIAASNIKKMQYILFDDCNMSNVETAYALKDVTDYLIGCPTEIMAYGMPYSKMWSYLVNVSPDYGKICDEFYNFYSTYHPGEYDCGTIGVADCSQVDSIASLMKQINAKYTFDTSLTNSIQNLDGYDPPVFFDFGDYVSHLCTDATLLATFDKQLNLLVPYKSHTEYYYSNLYRPGRHLISAYSGITISDPSTNSLAAGKTSTAFYTASH